MAKTIHLISGSEEAKFAIKAAYKQGVDVFVTDGNPDAPAFKKATAYAVASTYDAEATLRAAQSFIAQGGRLDGVMVCAADTPYQVYYVAEHLGLHNIGRQAAVNLSNKLIMADAFAKNNVPSPKTKMLAIKDDQRAIVYNPLPIVIKPVDSRGGRGVSIVRELDQIQPAIRAAFAETRLTHIIYQTYLPGPQLSVEGMMLNGKAYIPMIFDRNYEYLQRYAPYVIENGGEMPSVYSNIYRDEITDIMTQAGLAVGLTDGPIKGDLVIHEGKIKVIEIAGRLSGGFFATVCAKYATTVDLVDLNIRWCLGETIDPAELTPKIWRPAAIRFAFPGEGKVKSVVGDMWTDNCLYHHIFAKPGDVLHKPTKHPDRPAVAVASGETLSVAIANANYCLNQLEWNFEQPTN